MTLTTRIVIAMVAGIALGSLLNVMAAQDWLSEVFRAFVDDYIVLGLFDVVGRIFIASLKLLVVPWFLCLWCAGPPVLVPVRAWAALR